MTYTAPLADIRFLLNHLIGMENVTALSGYESATSDVINAVLDEAAKMASEIFSPLNHSGDKQGAQFSDHHVTMPDGFRAAYKAHVDGGWNGLPVSTDLGGQGLPWVIAMAVQEMTQAANLSLALCTLLNQGAIELLSEHGSTALKEKFLPKLVSGEWTGTMNLTESSAGSDVGAVRCKAVRDATAYRITGQKIFISYGDHDLSDNILHFVLARLPDAPEGTRGLSLFLVPKILVNDDGALSATNDVRVVSIEHKLGQHASPTCIMAFGDNGGAEGYLVGAENGGINAMFTMMNNARIGVGIQGLALMERATQQAITYAKTRVQSRDLRKPKEPPVAIIRHPDVRRMVMMMRAQTEAARALAYVCGYQGDVSKHASANTIKQAALTRVDLLTPVVKSWLTDLGNEVTSMAVQVFGGMGYVEETGVAQHMRDARVLGIYEGTNGIQANDLVFRKMARDEGTAFNALIAETHDVLLELARQRGDDAAVMHQQLATAVGCLTDAGAWILYQAKADPLSAAASASVFLRLMGNVIGGAYLIKSALIAQTLLADRNSDTGFLTAKIITARFYAEHILPLSTGLATIIMEGSGTIMAMPEDLF